jgi:fumarate reductase subunit D
MTGMSRRLVVLVALAVAGLLASTTLVSAHPGTAAPIEAAPTVVTVAADTLPTSSPWLPLVAAAIGLLVALRWPRRAVTAVVVLVLVVFSYEQAIHSVHHLDDRKAAAACAVASASAQLSGTPVDSPAVADLLLPLLQLGPPDTAAKAALRPCSAHRGRAPPVVA